VGDRLEEPRVAALRIVASRAARRQVVDRRRKVREKAPRALEGLFLGVDGVVDFVSFWPRRSTTGGPATKRAERFFTMTE